MKRKLLALAFILHAGTSAFASNNIGDCSSDPKLIKGMSFNLLKQQLANHGWTLHKINLDECSGTGVGYCNILASNCKNKTLKITTIGGPTPDSVWSWEILY